jgi:hypothetical protein
MPHKWKFIGETTGDESFWCETCGALGHGYRTEGIAIEQLPTILTYHINMCAGGENPCHDS